MYKDYNLGTTFDKNTSKVTFDAKFEQLRNPTSHNRSQLYFQFYKHGTFIKQVTYGYDRFGAYSNVPPGGFASGSWQIDLSTLPSSPDMMRVKSHTRSCVAGDGRVTWDNIKVTSTGPAISGPSVMVFQPSGGLNDGTDQGGATSGKDTFDLSVGPNNDNSAAPQHHHFNSNCNNWWGQSYYQFDLSTLPAAADTTNVKLIFYHNISRSYGWPYQVSPTTMQVRAITSPWSETTLNYNNRPSISPVVVASVDIPTTSTGYTGFVTLDITNLYKDWKNGVTPNYGIAYSRLQAFCENANASMVFSSDNPDPTKRPRLEITYNAGPVNNPPIADAGASQVIESGGATTAVTLDGSASHDPDGDPLTYAWVWSSGSATGVNPVVNFANGVYNITLTVKDGKGGTATATKTVTVHDTIAPTITIASIPVIEASSTSGAVVNVSASVTTTDVCAVSLNVLPAGPYALGLTTVTVTATDCAGNSASATTVVDVVDTTAPAVDQPADIIGVEATSASGATVSFTNPAATDIVDGAVSTACAPASGSTFALGDTTVICTATDNAGNSASVSFNVNVVDTAAPVLSVPSNVTAEANGNPNSTVALGTATATDLFAVTITSDAPATFSLGTTVVTWIATDANGNVSTGTQNVTVVDTTAPAVTVKLVAVGMDEDEALFRVTFSATDIADPNPTVTATLNGATVTNGQVVKLERDDEVKVEFEHGKLEIKGMNFSLNVSATDASGNTGAAADAFAFAPEHHDHDKKKKDKKHKD